MSTQSNNDDLQKIIENAQLGSERAMAQLFDHYYDRIAQYAFRRVLDYDDAQDIAAQVFLKVVRNLHRFKWRHQHSFSGWIFRIASNEVNQHLRRSTRNVTVEPSLIEAYSPDRDRSSIEKRTVESELDAHQTFVQLHKAIAQLKDKHQDIIHMYYFERLSHKEIAIALRMREGTVRVTAHRALSELQNKLSGDTNVILETIN